MKSFAIVAIVFASLFIISSPALADENFEIVADSTMDGHAGFLFQIRDPGNSSFTMFVFEEAGKVRVYATRDFGTTSWNIQSGVQYICPVTSMSISDTWRFLDEEGSETVATVAALESITTAAGTYSCYKLDIEIVSDPGIVISSFWFSSGVGLVRHTNFVGGTTQIDWQSDLLSFSLAGGSGFFPRATGNIWYYEEISSPVESTTWGNIKAKFN
jgi:hypothetical protein